MIQQSSSNSFKSLSLLALGDSYTIGEGVERIDNWPHLLYETLAETHHEISLPKIIAKTGWTVQNLHHACKKEQLTKKYDFVSLLIGVNNQYQGKSSAEYRIEFRALLTYAIQLSAKGAQNLWVLSIPDWSTSPFAKGQNKDKIANEIAEFNNIKKEETEKKGVLFINITEISRRTPNNIYFAQDGLHFSRAMHQLWVDEIILQKFTHHKLIR